MPPHSPGNRGVTLLCQKMNGAWGGITELLQSIGLQVVARWPARGYAGTARLTKVIRRLFDSPLNRLGRAPWLS